MAHIEMSHGTHRNESWHTYEGTVSHTRECVMLQRWMHPYISAKEPYVSTKEPDVIAKETNISAKRDP